MDRIVLASVPCKTSLPEALARIHPKTRAIVVVGHGRARLVTAGDIMSAINDALDAGRNPADVNVGQVIPAQVSPNASKSFPVPAGFALCPVGSRIGMTSGEMTKFHDIFAGFDNRHIIEQVGDDSATVVTASERFAADLGQTMIICVCEGDPKHSFEPAQLRVPGTCNKPHAVKVTCN